MSGAAWWCAAPAGLGLAATSQAAPASASADGCPEVEYAYRTGYNSRGRVSVTHVVDERGYSVMLAQPERDGV